jgi:hypothetical protein
MGVVEITSKISKEDLHLDSILDVDVLQHKVLDALPGFSADLPEVCRVKQEKDNLFKVKYEIVIHRANGQYRIFFFGETTRTGRPVNIFNVLVVEESS